MMMITTRNGCNETNDTTRLMADKNGIDGADFMDT